MNNNIDAIGDSFTNARIEAGMKARIYGITDTKINNTITRNSEQALSYEQPRVNLSDEVVSDPGIGLGAVVVLVGLWLLVRRSEERDSQRWADREADREAAKKARLDDYKRKLKEIDDYENNNVDIITKNEFIGTNRGGKNSVKMNVDGVEMFVHEDEGVNYAKNANGMDKYSPIRAVKKTEQERRQEAQSRRRQTIEDVVNDKNLPYNIREEYRRQISGNDAGDYYID